MTRASIESSGSRDDESVAPDAQDALELLTEDHAEVSELFEEYKSLAEENADSDDRQALAEQICLALTVHTTIEEEIFYPAARNADVESHLLDEAEVEHAAAKDLIEQIRSMHPDDDLYDAKVHVLGEYIAHHVREEEDELFPLCRDAGEMDLDELGLELADRKAELTDELTEESDRED